MERIQPEAAGVSSESLCCFFAALDRLPLDMHSVIMLRRGKVLLEAYYRPVQPESLHRMFSVTKSFVALAVGCLAEEKRLVLDNPVVSYFPEYSTPYEYTKRTTVRDMLMMRSPHEKTTYKADLSGDWVKSFFTTPPSHVPGTVFSYDTSATHVLGALVEKITGMKLLDYLRGRFLDEIGFSEEAYCLTDPCGVSIGGSGLMARSMDIARLAQFLLDGGRWDGKQLMDERFIVQATSFLSDTSVRGGFADEKQGYGMQFWRTRNHGFMLYGIGGQLALCLPEKEFVLVTAADTLGIQGGVQAILDIFWQEVYERLDIAPSADKTEELERILLNRQILPIEGNTRTFHAEYFFDENKLGLSELCVITDENGGTLAYKNEMGSDTLHFQTGGFHSGNFPYYNCPCITSGAWREENVLIVKSRLLGELLGSVTMELFFTEGGVTISSRKTEGTFLEEFNGIVQGWKCPKTGD